MADTIRERIIQAFLVKAAEITIANGYNTDCGSNVQRTAFHIHEDNYPAINITPQSDESPSREYGRQLAVMPITIEAIQAHGERNPSVIGEQALGDLIKCIMTDRTFGGLSEDCVYMGGGIDDYPSLQQPETIVTATFNVKYSTLLGNPYSQ